MCENKINHTFQSGVSVIACSRSDQETKNLEKLIDSFLKYNTHHPFEIIIMDCAPGNVARGVIKKFIGFAFFVYIVGEKNFSLAQNFNFAAKKAIYPNLLFLSNKLSYTSDYLQPAIEKLVQPLIGIVAACPANNSLVSLRQKLSQRCLHEEFTDKYGVAVGGEESLAEIDYFILCSKEDFQSADGFSGLEEEGYEIIDFCLRMQTKLNKKSVLLGPMLLSLLLMRLS